MIATRIMAAKNKRNKYIESKWNTKRKWQDMSFNSKSVFGIVSDVLYLDINFTSAN